MTRMRFGVVASVAVAALIISPSLLLAQTAPPLGSAGNFAVLAGSAITNTGSSVLTGDVGVQPGSAITGFPPGSVLSGSIYAAGAVPLAAQNALTTAYNNLVGQACTLDLTGQDLGGMTLTSGVYCFSTSAQLTGTLTLNAAGNADAVFIFKMGSTLTTASGSSIVMSNGGTLCNVFWQVGSSATLGTTTLFGGNILAFSSITMNTGASVTGRVLARNGAVTLDTNIVSAVTCGAAPIPCPVITLAPAALLPATQGVAYSRTITGSGGTAPYVFSLDAGALPAGLTLTAAGVLSGTPTSAGSFPLTIRGTDANGCFAVVSYTLVVFSAAPCPVITLTPATLPVGTQGVPYSQTIVGSGGVAPYSFLVTSGALPPGLTLTTGGLVSGTPTAAGSSSFTIRGTDANGCFATTSQALVVSSPVPTLPQWGMLALTAGLMGLGYQRLRRRPAGSSRLA